MLVFIGTTQKKRPGSRAAPGKADSKSPVPYDLAKHIGISIDGWGLHSFLLTSGLIIKTLKPEDMADEH